MSKCESRVIWPQSYRFVVPAKAESVLPTVLDSASRMTHTTSSFALRHVLLRFRLILMNRRQFFIASAGVGVAASTPCHRGGQFFCRRNSRPSHNIGPC
jgi:hypothetical protein